MIVPSDTTSPTTVRVPPLVMEIAFPRTPHPALLIAAIVGEYRRLPTRADELAARVGGDALVRTRASRSDSDRDAVSENWAPLGPSAETASTSFEPSE